MEDLEQVIRIIGTLNGICSSICNNSGELPDAEMMITASLWSSLIIPKSPCRASEGCNNAECILNEFNVATVLLAILKDLPIPEMTILPPDFRELFKYLRDVRSCAIAHVLVLNCDVRNDKAFVWLVNTISTFFSALSSSGDALSEMCSEYCEESRVKGAEDSDEFDQTSILVCNSLVSCSPLLDRTTVRIARYNRRQKC